MLLTKPHFSSLLASKPLSSRTSSPNRVEPIAASPSPRRCLRISATSTAVSPAATALSRVDVLSEALPFIQRFKGKTVVVKYGPSSKGNKTDEGKINGSQSWRRTIRVYGGNRQWRSAQSTNISCDGSWSVLRRTVVATGGIGCMYWRGRTMMILVALWFY